MESGDWFLSLLLFLLSLLISGTVDANGSLQTNNNYKKWTTFETLIRHLFTHKLAPSELKWQWQIAKTLRLSEQCDSNSFGLDVFKKQSLKKEFRIV